jgi:TM2 domain-containing membrane protein YozV
MGALLWALVALKTLFFTDFAPVANGFRSLFTNRKFVWLGAFVIMALSLQGCDYDVPIHRVGNWRGQEDYLIRYEFIPPGQAAKNANLNSCSLSRLSQTLQCSGRGVCKMWDPGNLQNTLTFCECDRDWADPECRTRRQSQLYAYLLSMFFGYTGADQFYLGHVGAGFMKLFSLGGFGIWWVYDIIRIGSAPVYASSFRVAHDLPHFAYVLTCTMFAVAIGFTMAYQITISYRSRKRKEAMLLQADEEARQQESLPRPFADSYGPGLDKPVMKSMYGSFGAGGPGRM